VVSAILHNSTLWCSSLNPQAVLQTIQNSMDIVQGGLESTGGTFSWKNMPGVAFSTTLRPASGSSTLPKPSQLPCPSMMTFSFFLSSAMSPWGHESKWLVSNSPFQDWWKHRLLPWPRSQMPGLPPYYKAIPPSAVSTISESAAAGIAKKFYKTLPAQTWHQPCIPHCPLPYSSCPLWPWSS